MEPEYVESWYSYSVTNYIDHLIVALETSNKLAGRKVEAKLFWASVLFTRICTLGGTIRQLLPLKEVGETKGFNWDFSSVASLSRNFIECYQAFFYLCVEDVKTEEWRLRKDVFNLHDAMSRYKIFSLMNSTELVEKSNNVVEELRETLKNNIAFNELPEKEKKYLLKGDVAYVHSKEKIQIKIDENIQEYKWMYKFLSMQTHSMPMSYFSMITDIRGRGVENDTDKGYLASVVQYITGYLRRATLDMFKLFPEAKNLINKEHSKILDSPLLSYSQSIKK